MKLLPIYKDNRPQWSAVELATPLDREELDVVGALERGRACDRCKLGLNPKLSSPCLGAEGEPGGLLVIADSASKTEDTIGRPFHGEAGTLVRNAIKKHWSGPVAFDTAMRCFPGGTKLTDSLVKKCRGYLTGTIDEVKPTRIITFGPVSALAVFGRSVPSLATRRGYSFLRGEDIGGEPIPVFYVPPPWHALRNRFVREWFDSDLKNALTCPDPRTAPWDSMAHLVETVEDARRAEADLMMNEWVSFDVETMGAMWTPEFRMISMALCGSGDEDPWVWDEKALYDPVIRKPLERVLTTKKVRKVGQNVKYDQLATRAAFGVIIRPVTGDTRLARKLLDPEAAGKLAVMAELVGMGGLKQDAEQEMADRLKLLKARVKKQWHPKKPEPLDPRQPLLKGVKLHPKIDEAFRQCANGDEVDEVGERYKYGLLDHTQLVSYNARDSVATARLQHMLTEQLREEPQLQRMWDRVVLPAANALERVEAWGVGASTSAIMAFDSYLGVAEANAMKTLNQYPGVNWDSPDQVAALFFQPTSKGGLGLPSVKRTKGEKHSTDGEVLEVLKNMHPLPGALLEYRWVTKLRGTYASGMLVHVRPDGRIHPNVKLDGARSGRTSCTDPNLQNIPRPDSDEGKMARDCFIAPPGFKLLEVDYSQLELRIACMLSGDEVMLQIFKSGVDYHLRTAQLVSQFAWGIPPEQVEKKHRSMAKSVNFGVLYGKTANTLAEEWGVTKRKAQQIVDAIMGNFNKLQAWCAKQEALAAKNGIVHTWWDGEVARHRPLFRIAERGNDKAQSTARNGARNSPIQGTASEFCIASLVDCVDWIEGDGLEDSVKLILPVHDALLFEVREDMVDQTAQVVHEIMTGHNSKDVPLTVDFKVGDAWGSMVDYHLPTNKKAA